MANYSNSIQLTSEEINKKSIRGEEERANIKCAYAQVKGRDFGKATGDHLVLFRIPVTSRILTIAANFPATPTAGVANICIYMPNLGTIDRGNPLKGDFVPMMVWGPYKGNLAQTALSFAAVTANATASFPAWIGGKSILDLLYSRVVNGEYCPISASLESGNGIYGEYAPYVGNNECWIGLIFSTAISGDMGMAGITKFRLEYTDGMSTIANSFISRQEY